LLLDGSLLWSSTKWGDVPRVVPIASSRGKTGKMFEIKPSTHLPQRGLITQLCAPRVTSGRGATCARTTHWHYVFAGQGTPRSFARWRIIRAGRTSNLRHPGSTRSFDPPCLSQSLSLARSGVISRIMYNSTLSPSRGPEVYCQCPPRAAITICVPAICTAFGARFALIAPPIRQLFPLPCGSEPPEMASNARTASQIVPQHPEAEVVWQSSACSCRTEYRSPTISCARTYHPAGGRCANLSQRTAAAAFSLRSRLAIFEVQLGRATKPSGRRRLPSVVIVPPDEPSKTLAANFPERSCLLWRRCDQ